MIEYLRFEGYLLAIVIRSYFHEEGVHFISGPEEPLQVGVQILAKGHVITPHLHNDLMRTIVSTQEVIHIEYGQVKTELYNEDNVVAECTLFDGDTIILLRGGHGFKIIEDTKFIEIKQGPYLGQTDDKVFIKKKMDAAPKS